jgi:hypothetical protein
VTLKWRTGVAPAGPQLRSPLVWSRAADKFHNELNAFQLLLSWHLARQGFSIVYAALVLPAPNHGEDAAWGQRRVAPDKDSYHPAPQAFFRLLLRCKKPGGGWCPQSGGACGDTPALSEHWVWLLPGGACSRQPQGRLNCQPNRRAKVSVNQNNELSHIIRRRTSAQVPDDAA